MKECKHPREWRRTEPSGRWVAVSCDGCATVIAFEGPCMCGCRPFDQHLNWQHNGRWYISEAHAKAHERKLDDEKVARREAFKARQQQLPGVK